MSMERGRGQHPLDGTYQRNRAGGARLDDGIGNGIEGQNDFRNYFLTGTPIVRDGIDGQDEAAQAASQYFDLPKSGAKRVADMLGFLRHRSNPLLHNKTTPTQTSCAGKGLLSIRYVRSLAYCSQRKPSQPSQRNLRTLQAGEALRGGKA